MTVLDQQLDAYERSTLDLSHAGMGSGDDVEVDELVDVGLALFDAAKAAVLRRKAQINAGQRPFLVDEARRFDALFQRLNAAFGRIAVLIRDRHGRGVAVQGRERFEAAWRELRLLVHLTTDRILQSEADIKQGKGRLLGEVMDELRARHRA